MVDNNKRVVVRAPNWLGDAVMCVAALRELRRLLPNAHVTIVARPGTADIFGEADFVDELLIYDRRGLRSVWQQVRDWKRRRFDLALLFQNAFEAAAIAFMARVPMRFGYRTERRGFLLTHSIPLPSWKDERHEIFYYSNIVAELERVLFSNAPVESDPQFEISISEERKQQARARLTGELQAAEKPLALLCPGSINSRAKRWPAERYAELADELIESGTNVALIGSPGELDVSQRVLALCKHSALLLTGKTSVAELAALISIADVLITNDTGPAHIGAAVGTPTLVIFGPTNPLTTKPFGAAGAIIRHPPDCAPCMLRDCPIDHRCMTAITPQEVFEQARRMMRPQIEVVI